MTEGWSNDDMVLFSETEHAAISLKYKLMQYLPGHTLVGLRGWDDFIIRNSNGAMFSLPTVPLDETRATPFALPQTLSLEPDDRFTGKIKWYLKPLVFGGAPQDKSNLMWVSHEQHAELVVWWNEQYKALKNK